MSESDKESEAESEEAPAESRKPKMPKSELFALIKSASTRIEDDTAFCKVISAVLDNSPLTEGYFTETGPSSPVNVHSLTIRAWRSGASAPHPDRRRRIYAQLLKIFEPSKK